MAPHCPIGDKDMNVALYARVSTRDKDQNPETQLMPLRRYAQEQGWTVLDEWVDHASATDMRGRVEWRKMMQVCRRQSPKVDLLLVWRLDRAFRSVLDSAQTLEVFRSLGVGLKSHSEPWLDTTSPFGEALYYITVAYAQLERGVLRERVIAGMDRARVQGKHVGRPAGAKDKRKRSRVGYLLKGANSELQRRQREGGHHQC